QGEPEPEPETQPGGDASQSPENRGGTIGDEQKGPGVLAEGQGRGFDPDPGVVLLVLVGVDRVVAERPENAASIKQEWRPAGGPGHRRPAQQGTLSAVEAKRRPRPNG